MLICGGVFGCSPESAPTALRNPADSLWRSHCLQTPEKRHKACYGPGWEANHPHDPAHYDFYEISVEGINSDSSSTVLFSRRLFPSEVHSELLTELPKEVVRYEPSTGEFVFHVSKYPVVYHLRER